MKQTDFIAKHQSIEHKVIALPKEADFAAYYARYGNDLCRWYEDGCVIVLDDPPISVPETIEKFVDRSGQRLFKSKHLSASFGEDHPLKWLWRIDRAYAASLQADIIRASNTLLSVGLSLFPRYKWLNKEGAAWRCAEQAGQALHLDVFGPHITSGHIVRVFWNVDTALRFWYYGEHFNAIVDKIGTEVFADAKHPRQINGWINKKYLGAQIGSIPMAPFSVLGIAPNTMWLVNSQYVAHGLMYGRKMASVSLFADANSMVDKSKCYFDATRELWA